MKIMFPRAVPIPFPVGANNYSPLHARDTEITACAATDTKTGAVKQGMMQELLNGRIRLV